MDGVNSSSSSSSSPANYEVVKVNQEPNTELAMQIIPEAAKRNKFLDGREFGLPEGWTVELRPRTSPKYLGRIDRFFYQPGKKKQFRSLNAAKKCAIEMQATEIKQAPMALPASHQVPQISELQIFGQQFRLEIINMEQAPDQKLEGGSSNKTPLSVDPEIRKQIRSLRDAKRFARLKGKIGKVPAEILQVGSSAKVLESSKPSVSGRKSYTKAPRFDLANPLYGHTMVYKQP